MRMATVNFRDGVVAEALWLNYFNRYLYDSKVISAKEYALMTDKIAVRLNKKENRE